MKGVVLAGGSFTQLEPLTRATHRSLLPVFDRPLIFHALRTLADADVTDVLIVTGGPHASAPRRLLRDGAELGVRRLRWIVEERDRGPARALALAERFAAGGPLCVIGVEDVFERNVQRPADLFRAHPHGARIVLKKVADPRRHAVARLRRGRVVGIVDRPVRPPSRYAVTGIRFYDGTLFDRLRRLGAGRGSIGLADVDQDYAASGAIAHTVQRGWWIAADGPEALARASYQVARGGVNKL